MKLIYLLTYLQPQDEIPATASTDPSIWQSAKVKLKFRKNKLQDKQNYPESHQYISANRETVIKPTKNVEKNPKTLQQAFGNVQSLFMEFQNQKPSQDMNGFWDFQQKILFTTQLAYSTLSIRFLLNVCV